ncbi:DnaJ (Hsp40), sub C, member 2 [Mortierella sp. 14UC]|nr:DnaJ (Hsp40), sub C, member 2 [Mortierella sp. 14UC]
MGNSTSANKDSLNPTVLGSFLLGPPPADWDPSLDSKQHGSITKPIMEKIEPVGPMYLAHARRQLFNRTFSEDEEHLAQSAAEAAAAAKLLEDAETENDHEIEPDHKDDLRRDAKDWKTQDHYRLLGLGTARWRANHSMIKKAHRTKVLVHHPDKKSAATGSNATHDDAFFKCIQKAYEILSDPIKRRQPVFEREARFSVVSDRRKIPGIGTMESSKEEVEAFYGFWYGFESWRSFEYLDKEEGEGAENRDDKRYIEKKNKAERAKLKKEDMARLRKLVDTAFALDPRMAAFKEQDREAKDAKKKERLEQAKNAKREAEREAALAKELEEEKESSERLKKEEEKKEKEAKKKAIRKEKKNIKTLMKDANYGHPKGKHVSPSTLEIYLSELETILDKLSLEDLERIVAGLSVAKVSNQDKQKILTLEAQKLVREGFANAESLTQFGADAVERSTKKADTTTKAPTTTTTSASNDSNTPTKDWSVEEVALLIKAANKFPGGVSNRWETIAAYVALHTGLPQRDPDDVIKKSKAVQKGSHQEATVRQLQFQKKTYDIAEAPTVRYDIEGEVSPVVEATPAVVEGVAGKKKKGAAAGTTPAVTPTPKAATVTTPTAPTPASSAPSSATAPTSGAGTPKTAALAALSSPTTPTTAAPTAPAASLWTAAEQKLLEAGMKAYPPSWQGEGDRWDKIAEAVPGRTKKECKLRVKYLQEQVKAQKAAAAAGK